MDRRTAQLQTARRLYAAFADRDPEGLPVAEQITESARWREAMAR